MVALSFLVACGGGGEGKINIVSQSSRTASRSDGPTRHFLDIEFTMPKDFPIDHDDPFITMTDNSGRRFEATEMTISTTGDGVKMVEGIRAKFEVPEGSRLAVIHIGDYYDVDVSSRRITRRASSSAAS
jgi:hypothetical protein